MNDPQIQRDRMVEQQIAARGVRDPHVLEAMRTLPREAFLPEGLAEFAYEDSPLPIARGQTISQPYVVALMTAAVEPRPGDRILEIGTGSGYAAAVLGQVAAEVYTVERHPELADEAREHLAAAGCTNVHVRQGDGTLGWPEHAPFDGILVAAGGPEVPESLRRQLRVGGRMVIPVGENPREQSLVRVTRMAEDEFEEESLGQVRFVPLVGAQGWADPEGTRKSANPGPRAERPAPDPVAEAAEAFTDLESADLEPLLERIGDARLVLLGEATHGTSEFYRMRARITRELIERKGFDFVAVEADWPDAHRIDAYVRHLDVPAATWKAFARFPTWMWRNEEVRAFVDWLRDHNARIGNPAERVGFHGLDLYSLYTSIGAVLDYLDDVDPEAARVARHRYGCLTPWEGDPVTYGGAALSGRYRTCEREVVEMLEGLLDKRLEYQQRDGIRFLDAVQNARLVANAEGYYRSMYYGRADSWNLRDSHMFETLQTLLDFRGPAGKAVVWEHNSHVGDASATEMSARGELNVGQLCRRRHGEAAVLVGFGTDHGTVAAADDWDGPMEVKTVRPAHPHSYERRCHDTGLDGFVLSLGVPAAREALMEPRLERAIGVVYRPATEVQSHYFQASLPRQFDEYVWIDATSAVSPLPTVPEPGLPATYPFGE